MKRSWVEKRFDHLDEDGHPLPLPEDQLPEDQLDASYSVEPNTLSELSTWQKMVEDGEMPEEALRHCSQLSFMEYEVSGTLDFDGLERAKELLISPKMRRKAAGIDEMLTRQGLNSEQKSQRKIGGLSG